MKYFTHPLLVIIHYTINIDNLTLTHIKRVTIIIHP